MTKIAIIGAGMSGLSIATMLQDYAEVTVFEKSRGVSGRMSTRFADPYFFDHGAQYFTIRTNAFRELIQPLIDCGVVERWTPRYAKLCREKILEHKFWLDDEPRYVGVPNMNSVIKYLAKNITVKINTNINALKRKKKWQLLDESGNLYKNFDWVISSIPAPQAAALLPNKFKYFTSIKAVKMRPCFALMLGFSSSFPTKFDAAHIENADINWVAVNSQKPGRNLFTILAHSTENYAEKNINQKHEKILQHLCSETSKIFEYDVNSAEHKTVHSWLFANNSFRKNLPTFLDKNLKLAACGDWSQGGRVEGAFTSAHNLFTAMKKEFQ